MTPVEPDPIPTRGSQIPTDNWRHRSKKMRCGTCMYFVPKIPSEKTAILMKEDDIPILGRCRRRAPTMNGWPVQFENDWCGDHKLDENKI